MDLAALVISVFALAVGLRECQTNSRSLALTRSSARPILTITPKIDTNAFFNFFTITRRPDSNVTVTITYEVKNVGGAIAQNICLIGSSVTFEHGSIATNSDDNYFYNAPGSRIKILGFINNSPSEISWKLEPYISLIADDSISIPVSMVIMDSSPFAIDIIKQALSKDIVRPTFEIIINYCMDGSSNLRYETRSQFQIVSNSFTVLKRFL